MDDVRYAFRRLKAHLGVTMVSIVTLACAMASAVTVWSVVNAVLIHPLGTAESDRLVAVGTRRVSGASRVATGPLVTNNFYVDYETVAASGVFEDVAGGGFSNQPVTVDGATTSRSIFFASQSFFDVLGTDIRIGRGFSAGDDRRGTAPVAVLGYAYWQSAFRGDPAAVGQTLIIGGQSVAIVGIAPAGFHGVTLGGAPDLFVPLQTMSEFLDLIGRFADPAGTTGVQWMWIIGHRRAHQTLSAAQAAVVALTPQLSNTLAFGVTSLDQAVLPERDRPDMVRFAQLLGLAIGVLLVVGCLTAATPIVLRTEARRTEFAVRLALGATRASLAAGLLWESAMVAFGGAVLAVPASAWLLGALRAFQLPGRIEIGGLDLSVGSATLGSVLLLTLLCTLLVAAVALAYGSFGHVDQALRARAAGTPRVGRRPLRVILATSHVALALVLLSGAGLLTRSLVAALALNPGYDTRRVLMARVGLASWSSYTREQTRPLFADLEAQLKDLASVESVSLSLPNETGTPHAVLSVAGRTWTTPSVLWRSYVDDSFFRALGLGIKAGRDFNVADDTTSPPVAVISASLAKLLSPDGRPVGVELKTGKNSWEIIGVVPDLVIRVDDSSPLDLYTSIRQSPELAGSPFQSVFVRPRGDAAAALEDIVAPFKHLAPRFLLPRFTTVDDQLSWQMGPQKFAMAILGGLGLIVALLTVVSTYVLAESMLASHRHELAIRRVLGATTVELSTHVLRDTIRSLVAGIGTGLIAVWLGSGLIRAFVFGISATDTMTLGGVSLAIVSLVTAASVQSVRRVSRLNPASALREL